MRNVRVVFTLLLVSTSIAALVACGGEESSSPTTTPTSSTPDGGSTTGSNDAQSMQDSATGNDAANDAGADTGVDAGKVLADGLLDPAAYKSRADSPFNGVVFKSFDHFEDWEDGLVNTPGVTPSSTMLGSSFGALIDSVDGDDGLVDGKCDGCDSGFANGTFEFTFDAAGLGGNLPTHVGIAWTDGSPGCDAIFEAYDANDQLIGTKTATGVGDGTNSPSFDEDRYFAVVHAAGVKKIVVKSSAGGIEVDHLHYGR